ncbi:nitrilotriacetate monooxygenase [Pacificimonas flava]|uniref:Nitrilotriacetate monooxygenase n=2 Tax=Pacificimonas TaxID=1960290 RepID=A0A219B6W7_9SPHN|nr:MULTISPECIES: flavin reductase family protein [Pacificimonas]MBZ6379247.1 flavin reductase family protein [Pacificimonas aurantium]OWV33539.1 nitrilotriacetate monooxygenase [Pacificimonas flava]
MSNIDLRSFREALGSFVTGVTIVTARDADGSPVGLTANSFNSVSLKPPMVLWSLALSSSSLAAFRAADSWAVHVLAAGQEEISNRFAARGEDKFAGLSFENGPEGAPLIENCAARFGCRATFEYEGGDHAIFVGEVVDFEQRPAAPLIYHGGSYGRVMPRPGDDGETPSIPAGLPEEPVRRLADRGLISVDDGTWQLTVEGRSLLTDLVAVQATKVRLEGGLDEAQLATIRDLLRLLAGETAPGL